MPTIYISDRGDDKNDGLSLPIRLYFIGTSTETTGRQE